MTEAVGRTRFTGERFRLLPAGFLGRVGGTGGPPSHLISSPIEHPCVTEPLRQLTEAGHALDLLAVNREGVVDVDALPRLLRPNTGLVAVMLANHETGAIQPVAKL